MFCVANYLTLYILYIYTETYENYILLATIFSTTLDIMSEFMELESSSEVDVVLRSSNIIIIRHVQ